MHHDSLVLLRDAIKSLLDNMATEGVHAKVQCIVFDCISNCNNLLRSPMLETTLNEEVTKPIDHQRISLVHYSLNNIVLVFGGANFELLLKEKRGLLIIVADNFVYYKLPVTRNILIHKSAIIEWFERLTVRLHSNRSSLEVLTVENK